MPTFYLDTSSLAKRYRDEEGTEFIDTLFELLDNPKNKAATSFLTFLELLAMCKRLFKGKRINQEDFDRMLARILHDLNTYFSITSLNTSILIGSIDVIKEHALKAPDAQQLTTALELKPILEQLDDQLVFVADDRELCDAAKTEGLDVIESRKKGGLERLKQLAAKF